LESSSFDSGSPGNKGLRTNQLYNSIGYEETRVKNLLKIFLERADVDLSELYENNVRSSADCFLPLHGDITFDQ
jgi:hypothetical protein